MSEQNYLCEQNELMDCFRLFGLIDLEEKIDWLGWIGCTQWIVWNGGLFLGDFARWPQAKLSTLVFSRAQDAPR